MIRKFEEMSSSSHSLGLEQGGVANGGEQLTVQSSQIICLEKHLNQEGTIIDQAGQGSSPGGETPAGFHCQLWC